MIERVSKLCRATSTRRWSWALLALLVAAVPASAQEEWPEHGFFAVRSRVTPEGQRACEMLLSLNIEQRLFSLVWVELETRDAPLIVNYMNADSRIALAERVVISIDGAEVLAFTPTSHSVEPERGRLRICPEITHKLDDTG